MLGFRRHAVIMLAILVLFCLPGCSRKQVMHDDKYSVFGIAPHPMRKIDYIGAVSDIPAAKGPKA